jgi:hypothetical protein
MSTSKLNYFYCQQDLEAAFYATYTEHEPGVVTPESSADWTDWFDGMVRAGRVDPDLVKP